MKGAPRRNQTPASRSNAWPEPGDWARIVRDELGLETVELSLDLIEDVGAPIESAERGSDQVPFGPSMIRGYGPRPCLPDLGRPTLAQPADCTPTRSGGAAGHDWLPERPSTWRRGLGGARGRRACRAR